jgi:hypothetical protein
MAPLVIYFARELVYKDTKKTKEYHMTCAIAIFVIINPQSTLSFPLKQSS